MTSNQVNPSYIAEEHVLTRNDLLNGKFAQLQNRRKIRSGAVKEIFEKLENGIHFETPLVVNKVGADLRLVDGNHRWEAIKKYLVSYPTSKVKVTIHIFSSLNDNDEKELFTTVNKGNKQSTNDLVKQHENDIRAFTYMKNGWKSGDGTPHKFHCLVGAYPSPNAISFYRLVGAYFASRDSTFGGGYLGNAFQFIEDAKELTLQDVQVMSEFMREFTTAFGHMNNNDFLKTTPFTALMRIWMDNKNMSSAQMIDRWKSKLRNDPVALQSCRGGGAGATVIARRNFITLLNGGRKRYLFT